MDGNMALSRHRLRRYSGWDESYYTSYRISRIENVSEVGRNHGEFPAADHAVRGSI